MQFQLYIQLIQNKMNNFYTTLMAESEEEPKNLLMKLKEESEKVILKFNNNNNNKSKIMVFYPITSQQIEGEKVEALTDFLFSGL